MADKGYDSDAIRVALMEDGFSPVIPSKANRVVSDVNALAVEDNFVP